MIRFISLWLWTYVVTRLEITGHSETEPAVVRMLARDAPYGAIQEGRKTMDDPTLDLSPREPQASRLRSTSVIAFGSALPASVPALVLTGSFAVCACVVALVVACVGIASFVI